MVSRRPRILSAAEYEQCAKEYMRGLPLEHYAEAIGQSGQRALTVKSMSVLQARRPEVQHFNELLVQYHYGRESRLRRVVPDNMVLVWHKPIKANLSFDLPLQPVKPLWVLDYLSKHTNRKDYEDHFHKYERELKVLYYLRIDTDNRQFTLYHHIGRKYVAVKPNRDGRLMLPELDLEMGLRDESVRFWYQGDLLLLPSELLREVEAAEQRLEEAKKARRAAQRRLARIRAERRREEGQREDE